MEKSITYVIADTKYINANNIVHGLLDGVIPVCKAIQTEVATPDTIGFISSLFFVGSAIGGYC